MKKISHFKSYLILLAVTVMLSEGFLSAQTTGTFTFRLTTTSTGGFSPENLIAIWIENSSAAFVKTKLIQSSNDNLDHLGNWTSRTGSNRVDATSGATLPSHGTRTVIWNGTNVAGNVVPDGVYTVWVEMAWASSLTTGKTTAMFNFTKGASTFHSAPANLTNFTGITLDWVPGTPTAFENIVETSNVAVFPNPTSGLLTLKFRNDHPASRLRIYNESGLLVYDESLKGLTGTDKEIDISSLPAGVYFVNVDFESGLETVRVVKTK
jgi:hypothetical protein